HPSAAVPAAARTIPFGDGTSTQALPRIRAGHRRRASLLATPVPPDLFSLKMNLASAFATSAGRRPEKIALYWGDAEYSYEMLWAQSVSVSACLRRQFEIKTGDRVGLWLKNCPEFIPALFGVLHAGAIVVPINNFLKAEEVAHILRDAGIDLLITDADLGRHFPALAA